MPTAPHPVTPVFWSDRAVLLYDGDLATHYGTRNVVYRGSVSLAWNPSPCVRWQGAMDDPADVAVVVDRLFGVEDPAVELVLPVDVPSPPPRRGAIRATARKGVLCNSGPCEGLEFRSPDSSCDTVIFNLINGPHLLPLGLLSRRGTAWMGRWELDDGEWGVTLDARSSLSTTVETLSSSRGHLFTHVGRLQRTDRAPFAPDEAQAVLYDLFLFLSFIRGAEVGIALPVGFRHREIRWTQWTSGLSSPYTTRFSWADPHTAPDLAELWPAFRAARSDAAWSDALARAVRYYGSGKRIVDSGDHVDAVTGGPRAARYGSGR